MNDIMIMGMPGLGFVGLLIIGLLAGLIAEKVTKSRHGLLTNLLLGVAGSYVGGYVAQVLGVRVFGFLGSLFGIGGTGLARGGVFERTGEVSAFARGGVVSQPTVFPMARGVGLMGEAGPEAVMPLRRGRGGRLGVEASGAARETPTRIINVLDPAIVGDYLATPAGERLIVNTIRRNRGALDA